MLDDQTDVSRSCYTLHVTNGADKVLLQFTVKLGELLSVRSRNADTVRLSPKSFVLPLINKRACSTSLFKYGKYGELNLIFKLEVILLV